MILVVELVGTGVGVHFYQLFVHHRDFDGERREFPLLRGDKVISKAGVVIHVQIYAYELLA